MEWFFLAVLSAFFAALVSIFAKIGLQGLSVPRKRKNERGKGLHLQQLGTVGKKEK